MPRSRSLPVVWCRVPSNLNIQEVVEGRPPCFAPFKPDVVFAISEYFYRRAALDSNCDGFGFVRLHAVHLKVLNYRYSQYLNWMCSAGLWVQDRSYQAGVYGLGYKWADHYQGRTRTVKLTAPSTIEAVLRLRTLRLHEVTRRSHETIAGSLDQEVIYFEHHINPELFAASRLSLDIAAFRKLQAAYFKLSGSPCVCSPSPSSFPYVTDSVPRLTKVEVKRTYEWLYESLRRVEISDQWENRCEEMIIQHRLSYPKYEAIRTWMDALAEGRQTGVYEFRVIESNGRLRTPVTEMPKIGRKFLRLDGCNELVSIDLVAAQPFLLLPLARELELVDDSELESVYEAIRRDFYTVVGREMYGRNVTSDERDGIKEEILKAFFSPNKQGVPAKKSIERLFPQFYWMVWGIKTVYRHNELAILTQKLESDLMIRLMGHELRKRSIPVLNVHDCVIVRRRDSGQVLELLRRVGKRYTGWEPVVKVEAL